MSKLPDAVPCPDRAPLHLRGGYLCVAAPLDYIEACFSAPAIRALRYNRPNSTMVIVCPQSQEAFWQVMPELSDVITYPDRASVSEIAGIIKQQETTFESSIAWEAGAVAKAFKRVKIYQRLGYPAEGLVKLLTDEVDVIHEPGPIQHRVRYYLDLVKRLCGEAYVPEAFKTPYRAVVAEKKRVIISPNSSYGVSHEWLVEKFYEVVTEMNARHDNMEWVIISDIAGAKVKRKKGQEPCLKLETLMSDSSVEVIRTADLSELIGSLQQSSALLACDGDLAHLAAHVGLPATVIFGPNEPEWKRPLGKQSQVLREHVACSPCYLAKCPIDLRCQSRITVDSVVEKLEEVLQLKN